MTEIGSVYGEALYRLAAEEAVSGDILRELNTLRQSFAQAEDFLTLLSSPSLTKAERCAILEDSFRGKIHGYLLNFLKILTEKGYIRRFADCCDAYEALYNQEHNILVVTAVTAVAMTPAQEQALKDKLGRGTGKQISLRCRIDPAVLGGIRLDYDGRRLDDTLERRLEDIRDRLKKTVL